MRVCSVAQSCPALCDPLSMGLSSQEYQTGFSLPPPAVICSDQSKSVLVWKERGHTGREVEITMRELLEVTDIFIILIVVIFSLCTHMSKVIE